TACNELRADVAILVVLKFDLGVRHQLDGSILAKIDNGANLVGNFHGRARDDRSTITYVVAIHLDRLAALGGDTGGRMLRVTLRRRRTCQGAMHVSCGKQKRSENEGDKFLFASHVQITPWVKPETLSRAIKSAQFTHASAKRQIREARIVQ